MEETPLASVDAPSTDAAQAAPPSPAPEPTAPSTASAGDTAVATDARSVFREMQAAKSEGTPPDAPPDPSLAQAATQPDGTSEAPGLLPNRGPIPFDRHQAVLTRTRNEVSEKARRETLAEFGIAEGVTPKVVAHGVNLARMLSENPKLFLQIVQSQLGVDAAPAAAAPPKPAEDPEPEPDIPLTDGRATMSVERLREWNAWNERRLTKQFDEKYGPIRDAHELNTLKETRKAEATQLVTYAAGQWPRFQQLKPQIREYIDKRFPKGQPIPPTALYDAYIAMDREHGERLLREKWEAERSGQLTRKAAASTVQPGAPRPSTPRPDSELTTREIIRQEARRLAAG